MHVRYGLLTCYCINYLFSSTCIIEDNYICIFDGNPFSFGEPGFAAISWQNPTPDASNSFTFQVLLNLPAEGLAAADSIPDLLNSAAGFAIQLQFQTATQLSGVQVLLSNGCGGLQIAIEWAMLRVGRPGCDGESDEFVYAAEILQPHTEYVVGVQVVVGLVTLININSQQMSAFPLGTAFSNPQPFVIAADDFRGEDPFQGTVLQFLLFEGFEVRL